MTSSTTTDRIGNNPVRLPTLTRVAVDRRPPLRLGRRDFDIVRAVWQYRSLTTRQVERLFFRPAAVPSDGTRIAEGPAKINSRCQRRLQLLFHHGYLFRDEQPQRLSDGRKPLVYFLDRLGAELLAGLGEHVDWLPRDNNVRFPFLEHLLATNDVRVAVTVATSLEGYTLARWLDDRVLKSRLAKDYVNIQGENDKVIRVAVVPDGYFRLELAHDDAHYFLELDRGTVVGQASHWERRDWRRKILAYIAYFRSGQFEQRYGGRGVRVLTVVPSLARLENLKEITEGAGGKRRFWFAVAGDITPETVLAAPIWHVATDSGRTCLIS